MTTNHNKWQNFQLIYKPELSAAANKNGSDIARIMSVDIGVKEKWNEFSTMMDAMIFNGGGMSLSLIMGMLRLQVDTCEGKLFEWLFNARF